MIRPAKRSTPPALAVPALALVLALATLPARAEIRRDPNGVNVSAQGATTVFITFGGLSGQIPVEASWCGTLVPAAPDIGLKCDPSTLFGRLPIRFDQSRLTAAGSVFTDIMSIPPSVSRRAYQAAERGETSSFYYVRRFVSTTGGPDEYVFVTCRLTGGGARTPLALLDVQVRFGGDAEVLTLERGTSPPPVEAEIRYSGTGRLVGRWEVVLPGQEPPTSNDLLTEATLPPEERTLQRRYTQLERFNIFLPPTGRVTLPGPEPGRIPVRLDGLYQILLRVEASNDKEGDSNLANAGAGQGVIHAGAVAGFPMPVLRYFVGSVSEVLAAGDGLELIAPASGATLAADQAMQLSWNLDRAAILYRLEIESGQGELLFGAIVQQGIGSYRAPGSARSKLAVGEPVRWRVVALGPDGRAMAETAWRDLTVTP